MMAVLDNVVQICESLKRQESRVLRYDDAIARPGAGTRSRNFVFYSATPGLTCIEWDL